MIELTPVESSQIHAIGHDPETNTLAIQFKGKNGPGSVYHYENFPADKFEQFKGAESIGRYFGANIKPATDAHPFTRQPDKKEEEAA
jgi:hypothetical protein